MGETTSLTIQRLKGEDISHQNYVDAGQGRCNTRLRRPVSVGMTAEQLGRGARGRRTECDDLVDPGGARVEAEVGPADLGAVRRLGPHGAVAGRAGVLADLQMDRDRVLVRLER